MAINELIEGYVSRQEAIAKGLKFYFTGKLCKRGHVAERYANGGICITCSIEYQKTDKRKEYEKTDKRKESQKEFQKTDKRKKYNKEYAKTRYAEDTNFKMTRNLRTRLNIAVKNNQKLGSAVSDLGCTIEFLKRHLESQFKDNMNWENHGKVWHIDHIEPLCGFDLTDREQLLKVCHYTNLQPLFKKDNLKKISEDKKKAALRKKKEAEPEKALDGIRVLLVD